MPKIMVLGSFMIQITFLTIKFRSLRLEAGSFFPHSQEKDDVVTKLLKKKHTQSQRNECAIKMPDFFMQKMSAHKTRRISVDVQSPKKPSSFLDVCKTIIQQIKIQLELIMCCIIKFAFCNGWVTLLFI